VPQAKKLIQLLSRYNHSGPFFQAYQSFFDLAHIFVDFIEPQLDSI
jgi:hypothetical protein